MAIDVLIDTSAWIAYFRRGDGAVGDQIDRLLDEDRAVLCGMVELELLQGVRPSEQKGLATLLRALKYFDTERQDFIAAGDKLAALRRKGITIPSSDGLIAALCLRHRLSLLTLDRHFDHLPEVQRL